MHQSPQYTSDLCQSLALEMACHLISTKSLSKLVMFYYPLDTKEDLVLWQIKDIFLKKMYLQKNSLLPNSLVCPGSGLLITNVPASVSFVTLGALLTFNMVLYPYKCTHEVVLFLCISSFGCWTLVKLIQFGPCSQKRCYRSVTEFVNFESSLQRQLLWCQRHQSICCCRGDLIIIANHWHYRYFSLKD